MSQILSKAGHFIQTHFLSANPPNIIPSPHEIVEGTKNAIDNFRAHYAFVQSQKTSFQDHLQNIGIERLSKMIFEEASEGFTFAPSPPKKGEKQKVIRFKWDSFDPRNE